MGRYEGEEERGKVLYNCTLSIDHPCIFFVLLSLSPLFPSHQFSKPRWEGKGEGMGEEKDHKIAYEHE